MTALSTFASTILTKDVIAYQQQIGVLQVSGVDSSKFLQGQISCDMAKLTHTQSLYGAVCSVKGRIIANFFIVQKDDRILLLMPKDLIEKALIHFKKYAVFFKTELSNVSDQYRITSIQSQTNAAAPESLSEILPTQESDKGIRMTLSEYPAHIDWLIENADNTSPLTEQHRDYADLLNLLTARPLIHGVQSEETLPQWLNMQRTGGISFTKGCYTGQEIVARMQYRGKSKKQLALFTWQGQLDTTQDIQDEQGKNIGQVFQIAQADDRFVAQVILNVEPNETANFQLDGQPISLLPLPYQLEKAK